MKSTIRIDFDAREGNKPVIKIIRHSSEDVRDHLLYNMLSRLGGSSEWFRISRRNHKEEGTIIEISAVEPDELNEEASKMLKAHNDYTAVAGRQTV